ncbi:MAG: EAL domain-containing protein [Rhizobiales bacterium]|nr:EAL domain-containing protein [Hyphomicrobiales bacterium]
MVCYQSLLIVEDDPRQSCILFAYFQSMRVEDVVIVGSINEARKALASKGNSVDLIICSADHKKLTEHLDKTDYQGSFILLNENPDSIKNMPNWTDVKFDFEGTLKKPLTKRILDEKFSLEKVLQTVSKNNFESNITAADLNNAILNDEIVTLYQPRLDLKTGQIIGAKAHIRWHSPEKGFVSPIDFLPVAEKTGLIFDLTFSTIANIAKDIKNGGQYWLGLKIAISLPLAMLKNPHLADALKEHMNLVGIACSSISLEIDGDITNKIGSSLDLCLQKLADAGFELILKNVCSRTVDFKIIEALPFTELNIDRSVVNNILTDVRSQESIRTIIALARKIGLRVAAEGIETQEIFDLVKEMGANYAQGYFISKPLPAAYITHTLGSVAA